MHPKDVIAQNFSRLREALGISQQKMAEFLGVNRAMVSYFETGTREIPLAILEKAADLFQVELSDFFEENPELAQANFSIAFRADGLDTEEMDAISDLRKVVNNYMKLKRIENGNKQHLSLN